MKYLYKYKFNKFKNRKTDEKIIKGVDKNITFSDNSGGSSTDDNKHKTK